MPSDWPDIFFGDLSHRQQRNRTASQNGAPNGSATGDASAPQVEIIRRGATAQRAPQAPAAPFVAPSPSAPEMRSDRGQKWPDLFFGKSQTPPPTTPAAAPTPVYQAPPTPAQPFHAPSPEDLVPTRPSPARISIPTPAAAAPTDLPTVTLPSRRRVEVSQRTADMGPTPSPTPTPAQARPAPAGSLLLVDGETITGTILAETPDLIYLQNDLLGVVTIPKKAIASRYIQLNLKNGDYVAGDLVADTPQFLLIRSPLLGTITIPRTALSR